MTHRTHKKVARHSLTARNLGLRTATPTHEPPQAQTLAAPEVEVVVTKSKKCVYICTESSKIGQDPRAQQLVDEIVADAHHAGLELAEPPSVTLRNGKDCWSICVKWPPRVPTEVKINWPPWGESSAPAPAPAPTQVEKPQFKHKARLRQGIRSTPPAKPRKKKSRKKKRGLLW